MRIAIIGSRGYPSTYGGFETLVRRLAPYLVERGHDVTVFGRADSVIGRPSASLEDGVAVVVRWGLDSKSISTLSYGFSSCLAVDEASFDVALVLNVANGFFLPILRRRDVPTVVNVDGIEWERDKWNGVAKRFFLWGAKATARYADALVADSHVIAEYWHTTFNRTSTFIPYGGDQSTPVSDRAMTELGLPSHGYALAVARLAPENNVDVFLDASEALDSNVPIVVVGSAVGSSRLEQRLKVLHRSGRVRWLGHIADQELLQSLWSHAGVYFHGHSVGGTNPALVQAMACGAAIVAADTEFNREVLGDDAGLVSRIDASDVATALKRVLHDPSLAARMRSAARSRAATNYTWDGVCQSYAELLTATARRGNHPE